MNEYIEIKNKIQSINDSILEIENTLELCNTKYGLARFKKIEEFKNIIKTDQKPLDVTISTMTLSLFLDTEFNVKNIGTHIGLSLSSILSVKHGTIYRTLIKKKPSKDDDTEKKNNFLHQTTLQIYTTKSNISVKLFKNGALHLTGCKSIDIMVEVLEKLFRELKIPKYDIVYNMQNKKIVKIEYVSDLTKLTIENLCNFKIDMINCNYAIGFSLNRKKLHQKLQADNHDNCYDPSNHAAVTMTHSSGVSIFIFEKGSIVITGARNCVQIKIAYDFINIYLLNNYHIIRKNDDIIDEILLQGIL